VKSACGTDVAQRGARGHHVQHAHGGALGGGPTMASHR
jgi:hypothetical protein